jgi:hypothetical protein
MFFILLLTPPASPNLQEGSDQVDGKRIIDYISHLASTEMEGRKSGVSSGYRAEEWLAREYRKLGLKPAGENGTYFQKFRFPMHHFETTGKLALIDRDDAERVYTYGDDYYFFPVSGGGHIRAEVVFIGYGISSPEKGLDEYESVDVEGKIVLCLSGAPGGDTEKWRPEYYDYTKADAALARGAAGLLLYDPADSGENLPRYRIWSFNLSRYKRGLLFARIGPKVVEELISGSGKRIEQWKAAVDSDMEPRHFATGKRLEIQADVLVDTEREAANVIGMIPGSDPHLKEEVVIISGHLDGGGKDPDGVVYHGANDNASGIGVFLEIARVMVANRAAPRRTMLFIGWGAEEQGGWGSRHFITYPLIPLDRIQSVFVLDVVGRGDGEFYLFGAGHFTDQFEAIKKEIDPDLLIGFKAREDAGSDQYYFQQKEIPSYFAHNIREDSISHTPEDRTDALDPKVLEKVGRLFYHAALAAADMD